MQKQKAENCLYIYLAMEVESEKISLHLFVGAKLENNIENCTRNLHDKIPKIHFACFNVRLNVYLQNRKFNPNDK